MSDEGAAGGPWVLVLDVGSSSARVWFYDRAGAGLDPGPDARRAYEWRGSADGAMEIAAATLIEASVAVIDGALAHARAAGLEIAAVAVTTFWHGLLGVDGSGRPLTPVYAWGDTRATPDAMRLREEADEVEVHARTGCFLHPSYPSVKLLWLRRRDPALFSRVEGWISFAEHLEERLFGMRRASISIASGSGLLDVHRLEWDPEWLECAGIGPSRLSPLVDTDAPLRGLLADFAGRWPELARVPWYPALGDGACANLGSGAFSPGIVGVTIGTSAAVRALWEAETAVVPEPLWCYRLDGRRWVAGQALSNGGNAVAYLRDLLSLGKEREWEAELAAMEPDSHGLTVLPFLRGERTPGWLWQTRATVSGLRASTPAEHLLLAWMEAIAYRLAEVCERLEDSLEPVREVRASGGSIHASPFWARILADTLGRPVSLPIEPEATSRGAALVVQERLGWIEDLSSVPVGIAQRLEPDPTRHRRYRAAMERQRALETALRPWLEPSHAPASARED